MKEALDLVRLDLGPDAVILEARKHQARGFARLLGLAGLLRKPRVQVTAAVDIGVQEPDFRATLLERELAGLGRVTRGHADERPLSPRVAEIYAMLVAQDISEDAALSLAERVGLLVRPEPRNDAEFRRKASLELASLVPLAGPTRVVPGRRKVVGFVGPTGVGKTTTIAKLAAHFSLVQRARVALITSDTYRIAAVEQIRVYAEIIGVPLDVAPGARDMQDALRRGTDFEVILIDTAGRSPNNLGRMYDLKNLMDAASAEEVHLVLSATTRRGDLERLVDRFGVVGFDRIVLTKLDESANFGAAFNVTARSGKPLSYFTTGQNVPEDIEAATCDRLAEMVMGRWSGDSRHRSAWINQPMEGEV
ncbi:MAG: flagellar GTP-binding protein [Firmicutes bacterium]|jgi:flagellar biosynthesis protein FlhF|nr:flagellar GTP-binding protein [Bacillota bacterium]